MNNDMNNFFDETIFAASGRINSLEQKIRDLEQQLCEARSNLNGERLLRRTYEDWYVKQGQELTKARNDVVRLIQANEHWSLKVSYLKTDNLAYSEKLEDALNEINRLRQKG